MTPQQEIQQLVAEIKQLNEAYRAGNPKVTDQYYDNLLGVLATLDPDNELLKKGIIEDNVSGSRKRKLPYPMMSLNKCKTVQEILDWLRKCGMNDEDVVIVTSKYNGISLLREASNTYTRGDGEYGMECSAHFAKMNSGIDPEWDRTVIGEAIITRQSWESNFQGKVSPRGVPYKLNNATVAGLINQDEPSEELCHVNFVAYGLISNKQYETFSKSAQLDHLNVNCSNVVGYYPIEVRHITEDILDYMYRQINLQYPCDGLVIDIDSANKRFELDRELNGNPAYARALKLDKWVEEYPTIITGHDITISKQGKMKGVVTFDPIQIEGTEVKQASFYNAKFIKDFCLFPGTEITVKKSGEIIPKIMSVSGVHIPRAEEFETTKDYQFALELAKKSILSKWEFYFNVLSGSKFDHNFSCCPSCGELLQWDENKVDLECRNCHCNSMRISKVEHFFLAIGVEEFGRPSVTTLFEYGFDTVEKIVNSRISDLSKIPGFGDSSATTLHSQITKLRHDGIPFARLMYAWDLFEGKIGEKTIQLILDEYPMEEWAKNAEYTVEELVKIKGVSEITAKVFLSGLEAWSFMPNLFALSYTVSPKKAVTGSKFTGFNVCFSGVRDKELEQEIEANGGKVVSGVSKTTTHLIVADVNQATSKTVKARELGCEIMNIETFKSL